MDLIKVIKKFEDLQYLGGVEDKTIKDAEEKLNLKFSDEYKLYLSEYGVATFNGREFTGIVNSKRLNVVEVTMQYRKYNTSVPDNYYVIEDLHIDNTFILQDEKGFVYQATGIEQPVKIYESIVEYVSAE